MKKQESFNHISPNARTPIRKEDTENKFLKISPEIEITRLSSKTKNNKIELKNLSYFQNQKLKQKNSINISNNNSNRINFIYNNEEFKIEKEKCYRNKLQRELDSLGNILNKEITPLKTYRNKPVVDLKKPELHYNYESIFNSPRKSSRINSKFSSPKKEGNFMESNLNLNNSIRNSLSSTKGFSDYASASNSNGSYYNNYNQSNYGSSKRSCKFTNKIGSDYKLRKYSQNNVLLASKTIKPNDSFDEFVKGKIFFFFFFSSFFPFFSPFFLLI